MNSEQKIKTISLAKLLPKNWTIIEENNHLEIYKPPKNINIEVLKAVKINKNLAWTVGFYLAEGNKVSYGIGITNSEIELLKIPYQELSKIFRLKPENWVVYLRVKKQAKKETEKEIIQSFGNVKISTLKSKHATKEHIEMRVNSVIISILLENLIQESIKYILKSKELSVSFLKGYLCGDGTITQHNGYLHSISITAKNNLHADIIKKALKTAYKNKVPINSRKTKGVNEIYVCNIKYLTMMILDQCFFEFKKQWKKLIKAYLKKQYTKSHLRYWKVLNKKWLNSSELSAVLGRRSDTIRRTIKSDVELGIIKRSKRKVNKKGPFNVTYSLAKRGEKLLKLIKGEINT